jgi:hypothetical protein
MFGGKVRVILGRSGNKMNLSKTLLLACMLLAACEGNPFVEETDPTPDPDPDPVVTDGGINGAGAPVTGAFQFFDDGVEAGGLTTFGGSFTPFLYEQRLRMDILVSAPIVPVPSSLALLLSGVAIAGLAAGKRGRKSRAAAP